MNQVKTILLFVCIFQLSIPGRAQIDWDSPFMEIGKTDGLPSTYIKDFAEDEYGFIWILTYNALCRFDGSHLEVIRDTLFPKDRFGKLQYDPEHQLLWISSFDGLYSYHPISGRVSNYAPKEGFGRDLIHSISLGENGDLWFGRTGNIGGLGKISIEEDSIYQYPVIVDQADAAAGGYNEIWEVQPDPVHRNRIWLGTNSGVVVFDPSNGRFEYADKLLGDYASLAYEDIFINPSSNQLYFKVMPKAGKELFSYLIFDPQADKVVRTISFKDQSENRNICALQDSLILISTSHGINYYNEKNGKITRQFMNKVNSSNFYKADFVDSHGNVWVGAQESVRMYKTTRTSAELHFYHSDYPNWYHVVNDLFADSLEQAVYMAVFGGEGLYRFDLNEKRWQLFPQLDKNGQQIKTGFTGVNRFPGGRIGVQGNEGFFRVNSRNEMEKAENLPALNETWIRGFVDSHDFLWGTHNDVVEKIDLKQHSVEDITSRVTNCQRNRRIIFFEDSRSNIWIGGSCDDFDRFDREKNTFQSINYSALTDAQFIASFDERAGHIWALANNADILILDVTGQELEVLEVIPLKEMVEKGEINLVNTEVFETGFNAGGNFDASGRFWFVTEMGVFCYDRQASRLELFDESAGITVKDPEMNVFVSNFMIGLPNGKMVLNNRKGLCLFDPMELSNQVEPPVPYIRAVTVNNEELQTDTSSLFRSAYTFKPKENFIGFYFSALDLINPYKLRFLYKLEGVDEDWKDPKDKDYVSYTQLRGGHYSFLLKASNSPGVWSEKITRVDFQIAKLWYNKEWARGLLLASVIFLLFLLYFTRLKRAIEKEQTKVQYERDLAEIKMQALTAQMNPHFIFNSLNSIDFYIIRSETRKASSYLNRFSRLIRLILKNSRSNYVTFKDDLEALQLYLEIESLRFNHQFDFEIQLDEQIDVDYLKVPPMMVQPYVENAIWHGHLHKKPDGKILIRFEFDQEQEVMKCTITDNGIGRKKSMEVKTGNGNNNERKSFGMNITKDKMEVIKFLHGIDARVEVIDLYDENNENSGTQVELSIPI